MSEWLWWSSAVLASICFIWRLVRHFDEGVPWWLLGWMLVNALIVVRKP